MAKSQRMPFPSFSLALSRQEGRHNESNNNIQERNASSVEPPVDLMVSCDCHFTVVLSSY